MGSDYVDGIGRCLFGSNDVYVCMGNIMSEDINKLRDDFIAKQSYLLGIAHGSIATILNNPCDTWKQKLLELKKTLDEGISNLYYPDKH
jgi:hypothetical protein